MEIHHCENPVCRFVTRHAVPDMCPLCGGAFFLPSDGSDLVAADWVALGIESKTDGRFDDAFSDFEKAAAEGDAAGQCMLGLAYETGEGVAQSWPDAVLLYRAAAGPLVRRSRPAARPPGRVLPGHLLHQRHRRGSGPRARRAAVYPIRPGGVCACHAQPCTDDPFRTRHRQKRRSCPGLVPKGRCPGRRPCPVYVRPVL